MRSKHYSAEAEAKERVEALLRTAAEFTPEERAPEGLARRALARHQDRQGGIRRILRPALLVTGLTLATASCLLLAARLNHGRQSEAPARIARTAKETLRPLPQSAARPVSKDTPLAIGQDISTKKPSFTIPLPRANPSRKIAGTDSGGSRLQRTGLPAQRTRPLKAIWHVETVQITSASVIAPVWLAETNADHTAVALTPAVANIPLKEGDTFRVTCAAEDTASLPDTFREENYR